MIGVLAGGFFACLAARGESISFALRLITIEITIGGGAKLTNEATNEARQKNQPCAHHGVWLWVGIASRKRSL